MSEEDLKKWEELATTEPEEVLGHISEVATALEHEEGEIRNTSVTILSRLAKEHPRDVAEVAPSLLCVLDDEYSAIRHNALLALSRIAKRDASLILDHLQDIASKLGDDDGDVREKAVEILNEAQEGYPTEVSNCTDVALEDLLLKTESKDKSERNVALIGIATAASEFPEEVAGHRKRITDSFTDENKNVRYHATMSIKRVATRQPEMISDVVHPTVGMLSDEYDEVRDLAAHTISAIASERPQEIVPYIQGLVDSIGDGHAGVRRHSTDALYEITTSHPDEMVDYIGGVVSRISESDGGFGSNSALLHTLAEEHPEEVRFALQQRGIEIEEDGLHESIDELASSRTSISSLDIDIDEVDVDSITETVSDSEKSPSETDDADGSGSSYQDVRDEAEEILESVTNDFGAKGKSKESDVKDGSVPPGVDYSEDPKVIIPEEHPPGVCSYGREMEDGKWECGRDTHEGSEYCIFHASVEDKEDEKVREAFLKEMRNKGRESKRLIGARFGLLDLSFEKIDPPDNYPIDLRHSAFTALNSLRAEFESDILLKYATVGLADFNNAKFDGKAVFHGSSFGEFTAERARFLDLLRFTGASVYDELSMWNTEMSDDAYLNDMYIGSDADLRSISTFLLKLSSSEIQGDLILRGAKTEKLFLKTAEVCGGVNVFDSTIGGTINLREASVHESLEISSSEVNGKLALIDTNIQGKFSLSKSTVSGEIVALNASLHSVEFSDSSISELTAQSTDIQKSFSVRDTVFQGYCAVGITAEELSLDDCEFLGGLTISGTDVGSLLSVVNSYMKDEFSIMGTEFGEEVDMTQSEFEGIEFQEYGFGESSGYMIVDLSNSHLHGGTISISDEANIVYNLENSKVGDIGFDTDNDEVRLFDHLHIQNTDFDGFNFSSYMDELDEVGWRIDNIIEEVDVSGEAKRHQKEIIQNITETKENLEAISENYEKYGSNLEKVLTPLLNELDNEFESFDMDAKTLESGDMDLEEVLDRIMKFIQSDEIKKEIREEDETAPGDLENTYLKAKNGANRIDANQVASEFFVREMRFRRKRHAAEVRDKGSIFQRVGAAWDWLANLTMDLSAGYGERPRNVILTSAGVVGGFSLLYWSFGSLENGTVSEYFLFSLQSFIQFIVGTSPRGDLPVRLAAAFEGFLGAFLIALFVFTLTRSLNR